MQGYYGGAVRPYESVTSKGVLYVYRAFAFLIVAGILGVAMALVVPGVGGMVGSLNLTDNNTNSGALSQLAGVLALVCGLLLIYLIGLILALLGIWSIYKGKAEYGDRHEKSVDLALLFFGGVIALFIMTVVVGIGAAMSQMAGSGGVSPRTVAPSALMMSVAGALGVAMAILVVLMFYYLVNNLMAPEKRDVFVVAMGIYALSSALSWILSVFFSPSAAYYADPINVEYEMVWTLPSILGGLFSLVAMVMFLFLFREIGIRLKSKVLKPIWETALPQAYQPVQEVRWQPPPGT